MKYGVLLATLLAGCALPAANDLQFVTEDFVSQGALVEVIDFGPTSEANGIEDCEVTYAVVGRVDDAADDCEACDLSMGIDVVLESDSCDPRPGGYGSAERTGASVGLGEAGTWLHDGSSWSFWVPGDPGNSDFTGATAWENQPGDWRMRKQLDLEWIAPE